MLGIDATRTYGAAELRRRRFQRIDWGGDEVAVTLNWGQAHAAYACAAVVYAVQARAVHAIDMCPYWPHIYRMYCARLFCMYQRRAHMCSMHLSESHLSPS
jgi:hypothetical protein